MENLPRENISKSDFVPLEHRFEASLIGTVDCDWDDKGYIEARDSGDRQKATEIVDSWVQSHDVAPLDSWKKMSSDDRREAMLSWVEQHRPEGWEDPTEPPLLQEFTGRDERIPRTFLSDLHYAVATEIARRLQISEDDVIPHLEVYSSSNTPIDTLYGTDFFFKFRFNTDEGDKEIRYCIDITKDRKLKMQKLDGRTDKADYILSFELEDQLGDRKPVTKDDIELKAREIAQGLIHKAQSELKRMQMAA